MKQCPKCGMTMDAHSECPACGCDLTNEPYGTGKYEKYRLNRYFLLFLFRRQKFALFCTVIVLVAVFATNSFNPYALFSVGLLVAMWFETLFKNLAIRLFNLFCDEDFYDQDHLETLHAIRVYVFGVLAVVWAVVLPLLQSAVSIVDLH